MTRYRCGSCQGTYVSTQLDEYGAPFEYYHVCPTHLPIFDDKTENQMVNGKTKPVRKIVGWMPIPRRRDERRKKTGRFITEMREGVPHEIEETVIAAEGLGREVIG